MDDKLTGLTTLPLAEVELRIRLLAKIAEEARADNDERWKDTVAPQLELLQAARAVIIKREREQAGIMEPEPVIIQTKAAYMKGQSHGRG